MGSRRRQLEDRAAPELTAQYRRAIEIARVVEDQFGVGVLAVDSAAEAIDHPCPAGPDGAHQKHNHREEGQPLDHGIRESPGSHVALRSETPMRLNLEAALLPAALNHSIGRVRNTRE